MPTAANNADITQLEGILRGKSLNGGNLEERVRLYAYYKDPSRDLLIGVLALPIWQGKAFNSSHASSNDPLTWNTGPYLVALRDLPSRVSVVPDMSCSFIRIEYDIKAKSIKQNTCIN